MHHDTRSFTHRLDAAASLGFTLVLLAAAGCTTDDGRTGQSSDELSAAQCDYFAVNGKVTICHHTSSANKPYHVLRVAVAGCDAHSAHDGDYIAYGDPTCNGQGCFPLGAPYDGTVECCAGLTPVDGVCAPAIVCGDGTVEGTEQCDDGNVASGDGCSSSCTVEDDGPIIDGVHYTVAGPTTDLPVSGNPNAAPYAYACPGGSLAVGYQGHTYNYFGFARIGQLAMICSTRTGDVVTPTVGSGVDTFFSVRCPQGSALAGQTLSVDLHSIVGLCRPVAEIYGGGTTTSTIGPIEYPTGAADPTFVTSECPAGQVASGMVGTFGSIVDSTGLQCRQLTH